MKWRIAAITNNIYPEVQPSGQPKVQPRHAESLADNTVINNIRSEPTAKRKCHSLIYFKIINVIDIIMEDECGTFTSTSPSATASLRK